jgi:uncharacterized protein (TIGR03382 family)
MKMNATRDRRRLCAGAVLAGWTGLVTLALLLTGCGGVSGIPIDETSTRIADTVCPKAYMCCTSDQLAMNEAQAGTDVASCETATKQSYQSLLGTLQASMNQNRATYQSAEVDACLAKIMNSDCATLNVTSHVSGIPGCESFTTPLVAKGNACSQNYECIEGWCNVPASGGDGVCEGFVPFGQSCALAGGPSCGPNAVCDPEGTLDDPSDNLCEGVAAIGGACLDDVQCQSLNCTSGGGSGMTCQAPTSATSMCFYQSGCSAAGGRPGPGTLVLFAIFAAVALARARRARRSR